MAKRNQVVPAAASASGSTPRSGDAAVDRAVKFAAALAALQPKGRLNTADASISLALNRTGVPVSQILVAGELSKAFVVVAGTTIITNDQAAARLSDAKAKQAERKAAAAAHRAAVLTAAAEMATRMIDDSINASQQ